MELIQVNDPTVIEKEAVDNSILTAGQKYKLKIGQDKELDETVPSGKAWSVRTHISVTETDA